MENLFPPKAEMQYWGHCGKGNVPNTAAPFLGEHVLHLVLHVRCAHSGIGVQHWRTTSDWKSAKSVHAEH